MSRGELIPVFDVLGGRLVRAVAGDRRNYRPLESVHFPPETPPAEAVRLTVAALGVGRVYVADLDAITTGRRNPALVEELGRMDVRVMFDAGLGVFGELEPVIGLESVARPADLMAYGELPGAVFSLDLRYGLPIASQAWPADPMAVAEIAVRAGFRRVIVLDLASVGTGNGFDPTIARRVAEGFPELGVIAGGGVRTIAEAERWRGEPWLAGLLVGSALHNPAASVGASARRA